MTATEKRAERHISIRFGKKYPNVKAKIKRLAKRNKTPLNKYLTDLIISHVKSANA